MADDSPLTDAPEQPPNLADVQALPDYQKLDVAGQRGMVQKWSEQALDYAHSLPAEQGGTPENRAGLRQYIAKQYSQLDETAQKQADAQKPGLLSETVSGVAKGVGSLLAAPGVVVNDAISPGPNVADAVIRQKLEQVNKFALGNDSGELDAQFNRLKTGLDSREPFDLNHWADKVKDATAAANNEARGLYEGPQYDPKNPQNLALISAYQKTQDPAYLKLLRAHLTQSYTDSKTNEDMKQSWLKNAAAVSPDIADLYKSGADPSQLALMAALGPIGGKAAEMFSGTLAKGVARAGADAALWGTAGVAQTRLENPNATGADYKRAGLLGLLMGGGFGLAHLGERGEVPTETTATEQPPTTPGGQENAVPIRSAETPIMGETPGNRPAVVTGVPAPEEAARTQAQEKTVVPAVDTGRKAGVVAQEEGPTDKQIHAGELQEALGGTYAKAKERTQGSGAEATSTEAPGRPDDDVRTQNQINPAHLPEMVGLAQDLMGGKYPEVAKNFAQRGILGRFLGATESRPNAKIDIAKEAFQLVPPTKQAELKVSAWRFAKEEAKHDKEVDTKVLAAEKYKDLYAKAFDQAKAEGTNVKRVTDILAHEIGHLVDYLPDQTLSRGNIFGRLKSIKNHFAQTFDPEGNMENIITKAERKEWARQAGRDARAQGMKFMSPEHNQYVSMAVKQKVQNAIGDRGLITLDKIREEMEGLSAWWQGTTPEKLGAYAKQGRELYADAFSALLNNPGEVKQRAPNFLNGFFNYLREKPEVQESYWAMQRAINAGESLTNVEAARQKAAWNSLEANITANDLAKKTAEFTWQQKKDTMIGAFDREFGPLYNRAGQAVKEANAALKENPDSPEAKAKLLQAQRITAIIGDYRYRASPREVALTAVANDILDKITDKGMSAQDLEAYLFHNHVIENRSGRVEKNLAGEDVRREAVLSAKGFTAESSAKILDGMKNRLGPEKWAQLVQAQKDFRAWYAKTAYGPMVARMLGPELMNMMAQRDFYATMKIIQDKAGSGTLEAELEKRFGGEATARIFQQQGSFKDVENTVTATTSKALALQDAGIRNEAKRLVGEMLLQNKEPFVGEAEKKFNGRYMAPVEPPKDSAVGLLTWMDNGEQKAIYAPKALIAPFDRVSDPDYLRVSMTVLRPVISIVKSLLTGANLGFIESQALRDPMSAAVQLPGKPVVSAWELAKNYGTAAKAAWREHLGKPSPEATKLLERGMAPSVGQTIAAGTGVVPKTMADFAKEFYRASRNPEAFGAERNSIWQQGMKTVAKYWPATPMARIPKIMSMLYLDKYYPDMPEDMKRYMVRNYAGQADYLDRPSANNLINTVGMFYNPEKQHYRAGINAWRERPGEQTMKFATYTMPKLLLKYALLTGASSAFLNKDDSDYLSRVMRGFSSYHQSNYDIVPLGLDKNGKSVGLFLPMETSDRVISGLLWTAFQDPQHPWNLVQNLGGELGGDLPGINPILTTAYAGVQLAEGKNPQDTFRGQPIVSETAFNAGEIPRWTQFLKWAWNENGGSALHQFSKSSVYNQDPSEIEKFLKMPGVNQMVGRFIRVDDYGLREQADKNAQDLIQMKAETRLVAEPIAEKRIRGNKGLPDSTLTDDEMKAYAQPEIYKAVNTLVTKAKKEEDKQQP